MFSNNIKMLRKLSSTTQAELAEAIDVSRTTISAWEGGKTEPDLATLKN